MATGTSRTEFLNSIENAVGSIHADEIGGTNDANVLHGFDGDDEIAGFGGNDTLIGGRGADVLAGDGGNVFGADTFVYGSVQDSPAVQGAFDEILDFQTGIDKIDLRGISGNTNFTFVGTGGFTGRRGEIALDSGFVLVDTNGDAAADLAILLSNGATAVAGDFLT